MSTAYDISALTILVVEENQFLRHLLSELLREFKPKKILAESRYDVALSQATQNTPDIIFAGWTPYSDVISFLREIRFSSNPELSEVPVVVFSSYSELKYVIAARDLGMNEYLVLPLSVKAVYRHICSLIERPREFIRSENFCGPDRRVKEMEFEGPDRRGETPPSADAEDAEAKTNDDDVEVAMVEDES